MKSFLKIFERKTTILDLIATFGSAKAISTSGELEHSCFLS